MAIRLFFIYFLDLVLVPIVRLERQIGLRDMSHKIQADQLESDHLATTAVIVSAVIHHTCDR